MTQVLVRWNVCARMNNTILLREKVPSNLLKKEAKEFGFWDFGSGCETKIGNPKISAFVDGPMQLWIYFMAS